MAFDRRQFLQASGLALVPPAAGMEFPQPPVRRSSGRVLATGLRVAFGRHLVPGLGLITTRCYEGGIPGPTLRVRPGDLLRLIQANDLPPNRGRVADHNIPHDFNTFNLHTHGLHVSPQGNADNVLRSFEPGGRYLSEIDIPAHHEGGTFWYHPHHHGAAAVQLLSGMAGVLIVEGALDRVPEIARAEDVVVCVSELKIAHGRVPEPTRDDVLRTTPSTFLVNGRRNPAIRLRPGEVQRWRIVAATAFTVLNLELDGHQLHQIATDGLTFDRVVSREAIPLAMGNRADVLVKAGRPGRYRLTTTDPELGRITLMTMLVEREPRDMALPHDLPGTPTLPRIGPGDLTPTGPHRNGTRTLIFRTDKDVYPGNFPNAYRIAGDGATPASGTGTLDTDPAYGRFDPAYINQRLPLGAVEEWTIRNTTTNEHANHPFHLHTNPFLVIAINGTPLDTPVWQDTISIDKGGEVVLRVRFQDFRGTAVLHCHQLQHEDEGMMQLIEYT